MATQRLREYACGSTPLRRSRSSASSVRRRATPAPRGPGRHALAHLGPDRAPQDPQARPPLPSWSADPGRSAPPAAGAPWPRRTSSASVRWSTAWASAAVRRAPSQDAVKERAPPLGSRLPFAVRADAVSTVRLCTCGLSPTLCSVVAQRNTQDTARTTSVMTPYPPGYGPSRQRTRRRATAPPPVLGSGPRGNQIPGCFDRRPARTRRSASPPPSPCHTGGPGRRRGENASGERDPLRRGRYRQRFLRHPHHSLRDGPAWPSRPPAPPWRTWTTTPWCCRPPVLPRSPRTTSTSSPSRWTSRSRMYAAGKIPGSFFRREGRPSEDAVLTCRHDRPPAAPVLQEGPAQRDPGRRHDHGPQPRPPVRRRGDQRRLRVHAAGQYCPSPARSAASASR